MGPLSPSMQADFPKYWAGIEPQWTTLGEYLEFLEAKGRSTKYSLIHWRNYTPK